MSEDIEVIKKKVTNGVYGLEKKDITKKVLKKSKPRDLEREKICKNARKKAHSVVANAKREISKEVRKSLSLSESLSLEYGKDITFDFLEESYGFGSPELEIKMLDEPITTELSESISTDSNKYHVIGVAQGCFAPIGVMSRNGRLYEEDHWPFILENLNVANKVETRRMLGTIGHHDKKVDDEDMANGVVSHVVSELSIKESEDGSKYVFGKLEILDTPAGNLLKTYYDAGIPLFVSSRGGGKLIQRANESFKRVDKHNFYLETWDVVREPGFLDAKPQYIPEEITEAYNNEENNMKKENETLETVVTPDMDAEEIVNKLLHPLGEQLNALAEKVSELSEKISATEKVSEDTPVEEVSEDATEVSEEATEEVSEETKEVVAEAEEVSEDAPEAEEATEVSEEAKEAEELTEECHDKEEKAEEKEDEAKAEEKPAEKPEDDKEEKVSEAAEEAIEEPEVSEAKEDDKEEKAEEKKDEAKEDKEEKAEECHEAVEETKEEVSEEKEPEVSEAIDYEAEYKRSLEIAEKLEQAVFKAMGVVKAISEERDTLKADIEAKEKEISESLKELHKYKLCEEFSISLEEASTKLSEKDYEAVREELLKEAKEASVDEVSEAVADAKEELVEAISEAKVERKIAKIHSVFAKPINEGKKSSKIHSVFND